MFEYILNYFWGTGKTIVDQILNFLKTKIKQSRFLNEIDLQYNTLMNLSTVQYQI